MKIWVLSVAVAAMALLTACGEKNTDAPSPVAHTTAAPTPPTPSPEEKEKETLAGCAARAISIPVPMAENPALGMGAGSAVPVPGTAANSYDVNLSCQIHFQLEQNIAKAVHLTGRTC